MSNLNPYASPSSQPSPEREVPELSPPQTVSYQNFEDDHVAASLQSRARSPRLINAARRNRLRLVFSGVSLLACSYFLYSLEGLNLGFRSFAIYFALYGLVLLARAVASTFFVEALVRRKIRHYARLGVIDLHESGQSLTIDASGVHLRYKYHRSLVEWLGVEDVQPAPRRLYIYTGDSSPIVVPVRAFSSEETFRAFCELVQRLWEEHHGPS